LKSRAGVSSPTQYLAAQITEATDLRQHRPHHICWALWPGYRCAEPWQCQTGNCHSLAPCRLPPVLAMEGRNRVAAVQPLELRRWSGTSASPAHSGAPHEFAAISSSTSMSGGQRLPRSLSGCCTGFDSAPWPPRNPMDWDNVTPSADWIAGQLTEAFGWEEGATIQHSRPR